MRRRRREGASGVGGGGRGRCEEEAADLISFSPSLIMASHCGDAETACAARTSKQPNRHTTPTATTLNPCSITKKSNRTQTGSDVRQSGGCSVVRKTSAGSDAAVETLSHQKLSFVSVFNFHVNAEHICRNFGRAVHKKSRDNYNANTVGATAKCKPEE